MEFPALLECPIGGETWPLSSYKNSVDAFGDHRILPKHVKMECPAEHFFSLATLKRKKLVTNDQANLVLDRARSHAESCRQRRRNKCNH